MSTFQFTDNGSSTTISEDGRELTFSKNILEMIIDDSNPNTLIIQTTQNTGNIKYGINLSEDTVQGVGAGSTTAEELRDALESIFFLTNSTGARVLSFPIDVFTESLKLSDNPIIVDSTSFELVDETFYTVESDGKYILDLTFSYEYRTTSNDGFFRIDIDDVAGIEINLEQKDRNNLLTITSFAVVDWTAGTHSIKFYARKEANGGGDLSIRRYLTKINRGQENV